ncbi:MAG: pseudouridine synthase [Bacteroidota bacterium]
MHNAILVYKPWGVLSRFTPEGGHRTLASLGPFPPRVYPAGRLDADSEGLLLLTDDSRLRHRMTHPRFAHPRTYCVQVEGIPSEEALSRLAEGVVIRGTRTRRAAVEMLEEDPDFPPRTPPIRFRARIPVRWVRITLTEGRNRQVRRMTAAVGHPTLRLVRTGLGPLTLEGLAPGESRPLGTGEWKTLRDWVAQSEHPGPRLSRPRL